MQMLCMCQRQHSFAVIRSVRALFVLSSICQCHVSAFTAQLHYGWPSENADLLNSCRLSSYWLHYRTTSGCLRAKLALTGPGTQQRCECDQSITWDSHRKGHKLHLDQPRAPQSRKAGRKGPVKLCVTHRACDGVRPLQGGLPNTTCVRQLQD